MNTVIRVAISVLLWWPLHLSARIGETPQQCDERYGLPAFTNEKGDHEYRSYNFNGKRVHVVFYKAESALEFIYIGPSRVIGTQQARSFTSEATNFFRALLAEAYRFSDAQIGRLAPMKLTGMHELTSNRASNGALDAVYWITTDDDQNTIKFGSMIGRELPDAIRQALGAFYAESGKRELKRQEGAKAKGF